MEKPTVFMVFYRLSLDACPRRVLKMVAPKRDGGQECEEGSLCSNTFVPFEFCSLDVYKLFNSKISYLKILSWTDKGTSHLPSCVRIIK